MGRWLNPPAYRNGSRTVLEKEEKIHHGRGSGGHDHINSSYFPFFTVNEYVKRAYLKQTGKFQYIIIAKKQFHSPLGIPHLEQVQNIDHGNILVLQEKFNN